MKTITNEQFLHAKEKYIKLLRVCRFKFRKVDDSSEVNQLIDVALWKTLSIYNPNMSTFSGFLYKNIKWMLLSHYRLMKRCKRFTKDRTYVENKSKTIDLTDSLSQSELVLFFDKFVYNLTFREIAQKMNVPTTKIVDKIRKIKNLIQKDLT